MDAPTAEPELIAALAYAMRRRSSGFHRVILAHDPARAERFVRAHVHPDVVLYRVRLGPWLGMCANPLEVLYPYRLVARDARDAVALIDDAASLFLPAHDAWRRDPLASRVLRRVLVGTRLPTFWCAPGPHAVGPELIAHAPLLPLPEHDFAGSFAPSPEPDDDLLVLARTHSPR